MKELGNFITIFLKWLEFTIQRPCVWYCGRYRTYETISSSAVPRAHYICAWAAEVTSFGRCPRTPANNKKHTRAHTRLRTVKEERRWRTKKNCARSTFVHFAVYVHKEIGIGDAQSKPYICVCYGMAARARVCIESIKRKRPL